MSHFFKPYEGKRPYLFISYPHKQSNTVVDTIRILHDKGYRLWYDEGIPAGSDWPANIAQHMKDCSAVICFVSDHFLKSHNCFSEVRAAVQLRKPILVVFLDDSVPDGEWKELLQGCRTIPVLTDTKTCARAILDSRFLKRKYHYTLREKIRWDFLGFAASLLLFAASAVVFGGFIAGYWSVPQPAEEPEKPIVQEENKPPVIVDLGDAKKYFSVKFPDSQQEQAIRDQLGKPNEQIMPEDLVQIKELYFCGNMIINGHKGIYFDEEGNCRVNGAKVLQGSVSKLDLVLLRELYLEGSSVSTVDGLQDMPSLELLRLEHTSVSDLRPLEQLPRLKTVVVSRDMLPLKWNKDAQFDVVLSQ